MNLFGGFYKVIHVDGLVQSWAENKCIIYINWINK